MEKYFVSKGLVGYVVLENAYDEIAGNYYDTVSIEFETEDEAQDICDKLNDSILLI